MSLYDQLEAALASEGWEPTNETISQIVDRDLSQRSTLTKKRHSAAVAAPGVTGSGLADFLAFATWQREESLRRMCAGSDGFIDALDQVARCDAILAVFHQFELDRISRIPGVTATTPA